MKSFILIAVLLVSSALTNAYWPLLRPLEENDVHGNIACYAHGSDEGFTSVGNNIRIIGYIPLEGAYDAQGIFQPKGFEGQDISALQHFKDLCNTHYPFCDDLNGCWAGGDTLGTPNFEEEFSFPEYVPTFEEESVLLPIYFPSTPGSGFEEENVFLPEYILNSEEESVFLPVYVPSTPGSGFEEETTLIPAQEEEMITPSQGSIACYAYSSDEEFSYVGNNIRVIGYIPLEGAYDAQGIFQPKGFEGQDISVLQHFKDLCNTHYPFCDDLNGCWAGGDTLGYNPSSAEEEEEVVIPEEEEEITTPTQGSIACYAHGFDEGFASVGNNIRVIGYISLEGAYDAQGIFQPKGFEGQDISVLQHFKDLCNTHYPFCDDLNGCWAGGDTLGYNPSLEAEEVVFSEEEGITSSQGSIACYAYSSDEEFSFVGNDIRVIGYISLEGAYDARGIFQPKGFEGQDISVLQHFKDLCNTHYPFCDDLNGCWAGGDTLGYNPSSVEEEEEVVIPEEEEITTPTQGSIACYAHGFDEGFASVGNNIRVIGYISLEGAYDAQGIFQPKGFEGQDISVLQHFKDLCNTHYPFCDDLNGCWAGGDTLGYNPSLEEEEEVVIPEEEEITTPTQGSIVCYAHSSDEGFLFAENDIRVVGYIPLEGTYDSEGVFQPKGFVGQDISALQHFKDLCNAYYPFCDDLNGCWAGGNTIAM